MSEPEILNPYQHHGNPNSLVYLGRIAWTFKVNKILSKLEDIEQ